MDRERDRAPESAPTPGRFGGGATITWLALLSLAFVPWVWIQTTSATLLFPWGTVVLETGQITLLPTFLEQPGPRPTELQYWPLGTACYAFALVWAGARAAGLPADQRVTAALVALIAFASLVMAAEFGVDPNRAAYPIASLHALVVAGWLWVAPLE